MDARLVRAALLAAVILGSLGASYRTPNFIVSTRDAGFAKQVGDAAEKYRRELAVAWLGRELPKWGRPCPITVQEGSQLGAGGATSFMFTHGEVYGWRMKIQGPAHRVLDSVLPHEVTHTIFATHFRQPLPRWPLCRRLEPRCRDCSTSPRHPKAATCDASEIRCRHRPP